MKENKVLAIATFFVKVNLLNVKIVSTVAKFKCKIDFKNFFFMLHNCNLNQCLQFIKYRRTIKS